MASGVGGTRLQVTGLTRVAEAANRLSETDSTAPRVWHQNAQPRPDLPGAVVKYASTISQTACDWGCNVDFCGRFARSSAAATNATGEPAEQFWPIAQALCRHADDAQPAVRPSRRNTAIPKDSPRTAS